MSLGRDSGLVIRDSEERRSDRTSQSTSRTVIRLSPIPNPESPLPAFQ